MAAHSQGGHVAAHWALRGGQDVDGVVLSNPYFRLAIDPPKVKMWTALLVGKLIPHLPVDAGLDLATLTSDPEMQAWSDADPLYQRKATPRWFTESGRAQADLRRDMARFDRPLLLLLGTGDRIADGAAATEFFAAAASKDKSCASTPASSTRSATSGGGPRPIGDAVAWISRRSAPGNALTGATARLLSCARREARHEDRQRQRRSGPHAPSVVGPGTSVEGEIAGDGRPRGPGQRARAGLPGRFTHGSRPSAALEADVRVAARSSSTGPTSRARWTPPARAPASGDPWTAPSSQGAAGPSALAAASLRET